MGHGATALVPLGREHFPMLKRWITSERQALEWGGPGVPFPITEAILGAMLVERECWILKQHGVPVAHAQAKIDLSVGTARLARVIVDPAKRNAGLGRLLIEHVVATLFDSNELHRIELNVYAHNHSAIRLYGLCGFEFEGVRRDAVRFRDEYWDANMMGLLRNQGSSRAGNRIKRPSR